MITGHGFPCSFSQQRLWFLDRLSPGKGLYNIAAALRLDNSLEARCLEHCVNELVGRHESLRTIFRDVGGEPMQVVSEHLVLAVAVTDLCSLPEERREAEALRLATEEARRPFDLQRGPLLRVGLLQLSEQDQVLLVTMHHIISDGWSMEVFFRELAACYEARFHGRESRLAELPVQYADYAVWQREWLQGEELERQLQYWKKQLAGMEVLRLPTDNARPAFSTYEGSREFLHIDEATTAALKQLSQQENTTLFMTLLAVFQMLLYRYTGQQDIAVGTLTAGRNRAETEGLIGFFVNTLVLRTDLNGNPSFRELLGRVKETALGAYGHADLPFEKLVEEMHPQRDLSRNPLIQVTFQLFNSHYSGHNSTSQSKSLDQPASRLLEVVKGTAKFDLALELWEIGSELEGRIEYCTDLFKASTVRRMLEHWIRLLHAASEKPDERIGTYSMLSSTERQKQIVTWNETELELPLDPCIQTLFEANATKDPQATALIYGCERWTYEQLNCRANRIAQHLHAVGMGPDSRVGVCLPRTPVLVAALLGVLKAGAAYVPLDPRYPRKRLEFMMADAGCEVLISDLCSASAVSGFGTRVISVDDLETDVQGTRAGDAAPGKLAYVLYTSGSTGVPKGVAIEHRNAATLICWARAFYTPEDLRFVLASSSVSFDLSVFELFVPLCCGGAIVLVDSILELASASARDDLTLINTIPSAIAELVATGDIPPSVRSLNLAGEPLCTELVEEIFRCSDVERIFNLYGPTEDSTYSTCAPIARGERWLPTIGRPIANHKAYILDCSMMPATPGVPGELFLGGEGVARGYLNQPKLNAEKFLVSPFVEGTRLYRTGDLARYRESGEIEFLGRCDQQVKLRGYRLELGEVEATLRGHAGIQDAIVLLREEITGPALAAYLVPRAGQRVEKGEVRHYLEQRLPSYMIPSALVLMEQLPMTPNGKVDRIALQATLTAALPKSLLVVPPQTELERSIVRIWKDVLAIQDVGLNDNFFELGGHSLLLLRLQKMLAAVVGEIAVVDLFRYPTVSALAKHLANANTLEPGIISAVQRRAQKQHERSRAREKMLTPKRRGGSPWAENR